MSRPRQHGWLLTGIRLPLLLRSWPVRRVWYKQIFFSGIESVWLVFTVGALTGSIIVGQLHLNFGQGGDSALILSAQIACRELAPLLTALIMIARSASAVASELTTMQVNHELRHLERLGINFFDYLVIPRLAALSLCCLGLVIYFLTGTILAGCIMVGGFAWWHSLQHLVEMFPLTLLAMCLFKSWLFGALIAGIACREGLRPAAAMTDIPQASSRAVIKALVAIFLADVLLVFVS